MTTLRDEAARRVAEEIDNQRRSARAGAVIRETLRRAVATGRNIIKGRLVDMAFDPSNPPSSDQAQAALAQICKILSVDPDDGDAITQALASLLEAAGLGSGADHPSVDGSVAHEGAMGQGPKVMASAVARGRKMLGWK